MTHEPINRPRRRLGWIAAGAAAVIAVIAATAIALTGGEPDRVATQPVAAPASVTAPSLAAVKTLSVQGQIELGLGDFVWDKIGQVGQPGPWCAGDGGYDDVAVGAPVVVTDADGKIVGRGEVDVSLLAGFSADGSPTSCELRFNVTGVPAGKGFYSVEVSHRGAVTFDEADLADPVKLSLG